MRKRLMLLPLMLMAVMSISAESIIGTWKSATTTDSDGDVQIKQLTDTQLQLSDGDDDVQFTRVK